MSQTALVRSSASVEPRSEPLFRPEVFQARQTPMLGAILLLPRPRQSWLVAGAMALGLAVVVFLIFGSYSRKARIQGVLTPSVGMARIHAPQPGVVSELFVSEGARVTKGAPLLALSSELQNEALGATREEVVRRIASRRDSMSSGRRLQADLFDQQAADLGGRRDAIVSEQKHLLREIELQKERVQIGARALSRARAMRAQDLIPLPRLQRTEQEDLDNRARLETLERSRETLAKEQLQVEGALRELPLRRQSQLDEIGRNVSALDQELAEAETRRKIVLAAPYDGIVTAIQAEPGSAAQSNVPLMSVVPLGSELQASLYGSSRTIGFVKAGQRVSLRYQAFPYQKFGAYGGIVASVSKAAINPTELPPSMAGLFLPNEPLYRVTIRLDRQTAQAYGEAAALQPGMQIEADVITDTRRLIEWIFDPLYTLTGKQS